MTTSRLFSTYLHACGVGAVYAAGPVSEMQTESDGLDNIHRSAARHCKARSRWRKEQGGNSFMTWHHAVVGGING